MPGKMRQRTNPAKKKRKNRLINFLLFLLLLIGLALVFNNQIKNFMVGKMSSGDELSATTASDLAKNNEKKASFDFNAVESVDLETVLKAQFDKEDLSHLGAIAIPSIDLNLPIYKGVSNYALISGAGTMKEEQMMGEGNYALASHHMIDKTLLFSPLVNIKNDASIYLTDLEYVYVYKTSVIEYVSADRVDLIEDVADKTIVTLVTCDATGDKRLIVQGDLQEKVPISEGTTEMLRAFNLPKNNNE